MTRQCHDKSIEAYVIDFYVNNIFRRDIIFLRCYLFSNLVMAIVYSYIGVAEKNE